MLKNQKGFLLISIIFIMLLMAVSIFSINYYSVTQIRMASNQIDSVQTGYDLKAVVEHSVWKLTDNFFWRTLETGEDYSFNGNSYTRIVRNSIDSPFNYPSNYPSSEISDYSDAVTIQVTPKGASLSFPFQRSFRYYASIFAGTDLILNEPRSIFKDSSGNLYIASTKHHKIYKVDTLGNVSIIAGTGVAGNTGDDGPAILARLDEPSDIYKDSSGNIYIADTRNHKIRKVDSSGIISTIAGTGDAGNTGDDGPATLARLNEPRGVFIDSSGAIYIADTKNHKIRWINPSGKIRPIAGTGTSGDAGDGGDALSAQLNEPSGIFKDATGLYIADTKNHKIRKVDLSTNIISRIAGSETSTSGDAGDGGDALSSLLNEPRSVFKDGTDLYIADTKNHKIRKVDLSTSIISTIAGTGDAGNTGDGAAATSARLNEPNNMVFFSGELYIADTKNHIIRKVDTSDDISTIVGGGVLGDGGFAPLARLNEPNGIFKDGTDLYIADTRHHRIRKIDLSTNIITTVAGTGSSGDTGDGGPATDAELNEPRGIFKDGTDLYIADTKNHRIRKIDLSTNIITTIAGGGDQDPGDGGPATDAKLNEPSGIFKEGSDLYIADTSKNRIRMVDSSGDISTVAGTGASGDTGDGGPATDAKLDEPRGIFKEGSDLYIADTKNNKIRMVDSSGDISTVVGTGASGDTGDGGPATSALLKEPRDIFVDHNKNIFIVDWGNKRVRVVNAIDNIIYTIAGTGNSSDSADMPAVYADLKDPAGITMDSSYGGRKIFISDTGNHKIKVLELKIVYGL